ncbi:MAG: hypothetical protein Q9195_009388 [Heterodermia aff. obscurata]
MPPATDTDIDPDPLYSKLATEFSLPAPALKTLGEKAVEAKALAYCPYSTFRVGCAVLVSSSPSDPPIIMQGANVENASYPVGQCAEAVAVGRAVIEGHRQILALAVATDINPPGECSSRLSTLLGCDRG